MRSLAAISHLLGPVSFLFLVCMAFAGWFGFFRALERLDSLEAENAQLKKDHKDACSELNQLRANVAGGWPVTF